MPSLLVLSGPPGAGKSTVAIGIAARHERSVLVAGDAFFGFLASGAIEPWLPESHEQNTVVTEAAAASTGRFARAYDTVYDGVVGPWFLPTFLAATGLEGLDYVVLLPTAEACVERVRGRTGHPFSDEAATRKMHAEFSAAAIGAEHVLRIGGEEPDEVVDRVLAAQRAGTLAYC